MRTSTSAAAAAIVLSCGLARGQEVRLKYASFDPVIGEPAVEPALRGSGELHLVQFRSAPTDPDRAALRWAGATIERFLTDHTYLVRATSPATLAALPRVRWAGPYHPAYRLSDGARAFALAEGSARRFSIECLRTEQSPVVATAVEKLGGIVDGAWAGDRRLEATLTPAQLLALVRCDDVSFIDEAGPIGHDMDIARQIGGAHPLLSGLGFTGQGVRGEVMDQGFNLDHVALQNPPPLLHGANGTGVFGTSILGIVFASWPQRPELTGLLPDREQAIAGYYAAGMPFSQRLAELVDPSGPYRGVFLTSSIGGAQVSNYTTISAAMDLALFQTDVLVTQSMSNTGTTTARPEAWAKNVVAVAGIVHQNTLTRQDDTRGSSSLGPALDGRIKPDLVHFYDNVQTIDGGSATGSVVLGGTSASTPITAGYFGLIFQMWHESVFPGFGGGASVFADRPYAATARALAINSAYRYDWLSGGPNATITRFVQGWGMIDAGALYSLRDRVFIVNETEVLAQQQSALYQLRVAPGTPSLAATMIFAEPPGTPAAAHARVNDLSLRITAPDSTVYWGNHGIVAGNSTPPGGQADTINPVECIFILNPNPGLWTVEILASEVVVDAHTEDPAVNADFALVVSGVQTATGTCYANCDASTTPPILNAQDFLCFLNAFAAGAGYANCDGSTVPPVLNIADFTCFLNAFAAGCS